MLHKTFDFEIKEVETRVLEFTGSTEKVDRDGEIIKADGWVLDNYQKNPVVLYGHDYSSLPVAKCIKAWVEGGKLKFRDEFPTADVYEFADTVYKLCKGGYLNTVSVGFIPLESENGKGDIRKIWTKQELLEHSIVAVPSNPDALRNAIDAGVITVKEFERITKPEETENYIRIPVEDSGKHKDHRIRTIDISAKEGIKALYCGECKVVLTYLFDKAKDWDMEKAKKWVEDHKKSVFIITDPNIEQFATVVPISWGGKANNKKPTQNEIKDELDYLTLMLDESGISEENKDLAIKLTEKILRLTGSDRPDEIKSPIRSYIEECYKSIGEHHDIHNKAFESQCKALKRAMRGIPSEELGISEISEISQLVKQSVREAFTGGK